MLTALDLHPTGADPVPCEVRLSRRRRTLGIEVHPEPRVIVRAPAGWSRTLIEARVAERAGWIGRHVERFRGLAAALPPAPAYTSGDLLPYLGEWHRLEVVAAGRPAVTLLPGALRVGVPAGAGPERVRRALESWYRARARELFAALLDERVGWFLGRGHAVPTLTIRKMSSRWGTLASPRRRTGFRWLGTGPPAASRMTLNLALIRAPRACSEYVVVHELCHLEHRGHGRDFYRLMDQQLPDWQARKGLLESLLLLRD